ncbi:YjcQ protein [Peptoclostridium litorale DSM 5388]|uniref:Uncharacterized protein n=1 Tax=Peptoclostridium litorale DSM 5388 TaxID=1121324 RepID=A0A069RIE2_PEPLI|nr:YjcQ family protein [Peptoclostridium litorale]KDR95915.1 hypothetical protein CLIT_8c00840 [Peptoclostridium litorale DSM 5388]SIO10059.1 YjcQ protein [Peptoclostridium litorale DSM 5388]
MKTHDIIVKVLEKLDKSLDENEPEFSDIRPDALEISSERWAYILEMMQDACLIKGVAFSRGGRGRAPLATHIDNMQITLMGVRYIDENTTTAKIVKAAKLLKDTIPGL